MEKLFVLRVVELAKMVVVAFTCINKVAYGVHPSVHGRYEGFFYSQKKW
jgi:hypothetical protein